MVNSDEKIIEAIYSDNNQSVLQLLYENVLPRVIVYVTRNNGNKEEAQDIFQDAVLIFYNKVKQYHFDKKYNVYGYIYTTSKNLWLNKVTRNNKETSKEVLPELASDEDHVKYLVSAEKLKAIEVLLTKLGEPCKTLLKYNIFDELSMQEIVEKMNYKSTNVAKTYAYRCRKKLTELIQKKKGFQELFDI